MHFGDTLGRDIGIVRYLELHGVAVPEAMKAVMGLFRPLFRVRHLESTLTVSLVREIVDHSLTRKLWRGKGLLRVGRVARSSRYNRYRSINGFVKDTKQTAK